MKSPSKRQAVYSSWSISSTSELTYYLTAFPVSGTVHIFCVSTVVAAVRDKHCLWSFPFSCSDTGTGKGRWGVTWKYRLLDLYSTPVSSNLFYISVSLLQPHIPMLRCQFACGFSLWSAASSMNLVCEMVRGWLLGVNPRFKCSHVLKYYGRKT